MTTRETFLARMQAVLDALPEGPDKDKLQALVTAQDTVARRDATPRERARAVRRLTRIVTDQED